MGVRSVAELLARADGRAMIVNCNRITLATRGLDVEQVTPDWRTRLLSAITDPNVAMILMMVSVSGLIFEFMSPGAVYPGMVGSSEENTSEPQSTMCTTYAVFRPSTK